MKKAIITTISVISCAATAIGLGVYIPGLQTTISPNVTVIDSNNYINLPKENIQLEVPAKDAIFGTNKINNGTYVLYIGSEGLSENAKFMYDMKNQTVESFNQELIQNIENRPTLSGDLWTSIDYLQNKNDENIEKPKFIGYVHSIMGKINEINKLLNELNNYLKEIVDATSTSEKWDNLTTDQKADLTNKLEYLKRMTDGKVSDKPLPSSPIDFVYMPKEDKPICWQFSWRNIKFNTDPFATYIDINNETTYYMNDGVSSAFRDIVTYCKKIYPDLKDISQSVGYVFGFKNGQPVGHFELSWNPSQNNTDNSGDNTSNSDPNNNADNTSNNTTNDSSQTKIKSTKAVNIKPNTAFMKWIENEYKK